MSNDMDNSKDPRITPKCVNCPLVADCIECLPTDEAKYVHGGTCLEEQKQHATISETEHRHE